MSCIARVLRLSLFTCWLIVGASSALADQLLFPNADFETGTLDGWAVVGDAFRHQPTKGDNPATRNRESSQHEGEFWIGGFENYDGRSGKPGEVLGDHATGTLRSPEFTITRPFLNFLIGGGYLPGQVGVRLLCDGKEIELATGVDSESMVPTSHDVSALVGKSARIEVFDHATGDWGHVNVDAFTASDEPLPGTGREFQYTEGIPRQAYPDTDYSQPLRPQFHFTSRRNWLNDPNGMVFDGTRYHLFFQHNPLGTAWGNMTWGHATSRDMVHWTQHDHALLPYRINGRAGTIFSGTAVVDHNNSLGVQQGETKTLCAFFTFASQPRFYQAMAYSTDSGDTWQYWNEGRSVVENQGFDNGERDPKVFWHAPTERWVMLLWVQQDPGRVRFFTSENLVDWTIASDLMRDWAFECMDLVFLPVDGDENDMKAVVYDASCDYEIGTFDGQEFHTEAGPYVAGGGNFYAAQTFSDSPDRRTVQIGWMRGGPNAASAYGLPFNQQMSFPCELTLRTSPSGVRLFAWPIAAIESLIRKTHTRRDVVLREGQNLLEAVPQLDLVDMEIDISAGDRTTLTVQFPHVSIIYDAQKEQLRYTGVRDDGEPDVVTALEKLSPRNGSVQLRVLVDRLSVEVYAFGGERFYAGYYAPTHGDTSPSIHVQGADARINRFVLRELNSAWAE